MSCYYMQILTYTPVCHRYTAKFRHSNCGSYSRHKLIRNILLFTFQSLFAPTPDTTPSAPEIALQHPLGPPCDPTCGLVQAPCIERNAVAAMRAIDSADLASVLSGTRKISFDLVVKTMYETGRDLNERYRETSEGGLASGYKVC